MQLTHCSSYTHCKSSDLTVVGEGAAVGVGIAQQYIVGGEEKTSLLGSMLPCVLWRKIVLEQLLRDDKVYALSALHPSFKIHPTKIS